MEIEERVDKIFSMLGEIEEKLKKKAKDKESFKPKVHEKKNSHLHLLLETSLMNRLRKQSEEKGVSLAEFVRQKLRDSSQLDRIEGKIDKILFSKSF